MSGRVAGAGPQFLAAAAQRGSLSLEELRARQRRRAPSSCRVHCIFDRYERLVTANRPHQRCRAVDAAQAADAKHASPLIKILKDAGQKPPKELKQMAKVIKASAAPAPTINKPSGATAPASGNSGLYGDVTFKF